VGQQQEYPRQPLLARIEEVIDQVLFDPTVAGQQIRREQRRKWNGIKLTQVATY
jgi:hypothetical protein